MSFLQKNWLGSEFLDEGNSFSSLLVEAEGKLDVPTNFFINCLWEAKVWLFITVNLCIFPIEKVKTFCC